jgi:hypothetical protein
MKKGFKYTPEMILKRLSQKRKMSEENKEKLRLANLGRIASEETRLKMSKSARSENNFFYSRRITKEQQSIGSQSRKKSVIRCDGITYDSAKDAADKLSIELGVKVYHSNISHCCNGKSKTAHGYNWSYV